MDRPDLFPGMRVTDGTRTRDVQDHNLALCQLSYGHRQARVPAARRGENILPQTADVNIVATLDSARADGTRGADDDASRVTC